jgi:tripartite-type tricarboxylate transporter receptor subunit TctC
MVALLRLPEVKERLAQYGIDVRSSTPGEFSAMIKSETAKWAKVAQAAGISAE